MTICWQPVGILWNSMQIAASSCNRRTIRREIRKDRGSRPSLNYGLHFTFRLVLYSSKEFEQIIYHPNATQKKDYVKPRKANQRRRENESPCLYSCCVGRKGGADEQVRLTETRQHEQSRQISLTKVLRLVGFFLQRDCCTDTVRFSFIHFYITLVKLKLMVHQNMIFS